MTGLINSSTIIIRRKQLAREQIKQRIQNKIKFQPTHTS